jgi:hypothetical protein
MFQMFNHSKELNIDKFNKTSVQRTFIVLIYCFLGKMRLTCIDEEKFQVKRTRNHRSSAQ